MLSSEFKQGSSKVFSLPSVRYQRIQGGRKWPGRWSTESRRARVDVAGQGGWVWLISSTEKKTGSGRFPETRQNSRDFTILDAGSGVTTEGFTMNRQRLEGKERLKSGSWRKEYMISRCVRSSVGEQNQSRPANTHELCLKPLPFTDIVYFIVCQPFCSSVQILSGLFNWLYCIVRYKVPTMHSKLECANNVPYILIPYNTMQCGSVFLKVKTK